MSRRIFLSEYAKRFRHVGAVTPSSRYLARAMVQGINFASASCIVEYGPGTGVFTDEIVARLQPTTRLIVVESNLAFYTILRDKYAENTQIIIVHDSAEHIRRILKKHRIKHVDYVVSGLPFTALPAAVSQDILAATKHIIGTHGVFIMFQYTLFKKSLIERYFDTVSIKRELRNIPPAYVLRAQNSDN